MSRLILRVILLVPWVFIIWLISEGFEGAIDGLLVFFLLFILIPLAIFINVVTVVVINGRGVFKQIREAQKRSHKKDEPLKSTNYADLAWWNPRRWF